jgi:hypothetical protein
MTLPRNIGYSSAGIDLSFRLNGVGVMLSIDDLHGPGGGLASWFNDCREFGAKVRNFSPSFNAAVGDLHHSRPHHKATSYDTWETLAARVQAGLRHAANNTAFIEEHN